LLSCGDILVGEYYHLGEGYKIRLPDDGETICCPPPGHIGVYLRHFEFGLRFPLNPHVEAILKAMNVAVGQLMPLAIRTIIAFVWTCLYKGEAPTVNLFRRLHHLRPSNTDHPGWYQLNTEKGFVTVNPKLSSCKDWKGKFFFLSAPDDYPLPRKFERRVNLRCEAPSERQQLSFRQVKMHVKNVCLNDDESRCLRMFEAGRKGESIGWLPPTQIILQDEPLCHVGLIPALKQGEWGRYEAPLCITSVV
jgi:hypothetical protein